MYVFDCNTSFVFNIPTKYMLGVSSCLRQRDTSRKVAGSVPDVVNGIFHLLDPSGRTMTLGITRPVTEVNTRAIS